MLRALAPLLLAALQDPTPPQDWTFSWRSSEMLVDADSFVSFVQSPEYRRGGLLLRASWAVAWLDREEVQRRSPLTGDSGGGPVGGERALEDLRVPADGEQETAGRTSPFPNLFAALERTGVSGLAREIYLEGPVELYDEGVLIGQADAVYVDLVDGHGWISNVITRLKRDIGGREYDVQVRADWMRSSVDGTLRAESATVTSCTYDVPHVSVTTGDLRITPTDPNDLGEWEFRLRRNRLRLVGGVYLPLPPLTFHTEAGGKPILETFGFGDSARLGSFIQATVNRDMGDAGAKLNSLFKGDPKQYHANYGLRASYLGSRGVLADGSIEIDSEDRYWLRFLLGAVYDTGEDRGLVRVPRDERSDWRTWPRAQGRYLMSEREWLDLRFSKQSDPGVQAEFWQSEFLRYEKDETFLRWRKARGQDYFSARAKVRLDDFRNEVEELPLLQAYRGRTDFTSFLGQPLLYSGELTAGYLRRRSGDPEYEAPFPDGLDEREVLRGTAVARVEQDWSLGWGGLSLVPFVEADGTAWDRGVLEEDALGRAALSGGLRLGTTLWRLAARGGTWQLSPFVAYRNRLVEEGSSEAPVRFDAVEDPPDEELAGAGVRSLWTSGDGRSSLDVELSGGLVLTPEEDSQDEWQPVAVFAGLQTDVRQVPVAVFHDGRYSADGEGTLYSLTDLGVRLSPDLAVELSHRRAREGGAAPLFETIGGALRYRWTEKWEFEAEHELSLLDDETLRNRLVIRRFGHDLVFDLELEDQAGEGTSVSFNVAPVLLWRTARVGFVEFLE